MRRRLITARQRAGDQRLVRRRRRLAAPAAVGGAAPGGVGDYERATDPWVSFGADGVAHQISLSFNDTRDLANAVLASRSTDGGHTWSAPVQLIRDTDPNVFNDKESLTADWTNASLVYAIWDRLVFPTERAGGVSFLTAAAFTGPTYFARSTNGGRTWERARSIFDPGQNDQTIGNQIVVMPDGDLVNVRTDYDFRNSDGGDAALETDVWFLRSTNGGATWTEQRVTPQSFDMRARGAGRARVRRRRLHRDGRGRHGVHAVLVGDAACPGPASARSCRSRRSPSRMW